MSAKRFDDPQKLAEAVQKASQKAMDRAVLSTAQRVVQHIQTVIIPGQPRPPVDRSTYRAGWKAKAVKGGALVYNTTSQASIIEYGVRPQNVKIGRKMINALAEWARRKGIVKGKKAKKGSPDKLAVGMAWGIAKKMKVNGIFGPRGLRILEKAKSVIRKFVAEEIAREFEKMRPQ